MPFIPEIMKEPNICNAEMHGQVNQDTSAKFDLTQIKGIIMCQFADHNMNVFKVRGITDRKKDPVNTTKSGQGCVEDPKVDGQ